jgi:hypothetical protein
MARYLKVTVVCLFSAAAAGCSGRGQPAGPGDAGMNNDPRFPLLPQQKIYLQNVPGYQGDAWFIDVPRLAQMISNLRTS